MRILYNRKDVYHSSCSLRELSHFRNIFVVGVFLLTPRALLLKYSHFATSRIEAGRDGRRERR